MPEFNYYGTWDDSIDLVEAVLRELRVQAIWDAGDFEGPDAPRYRHLDPELGRPLRRIPRLFLEGEFTRFPPGFERFTLGSKVGRWYIDPSHGGPLFGWNLATEGGTGDTVVLGPGMVWYQPQYLNPETGAWVKPSPELRKAFRSVQASLLAKLAKVRVGGDEVPIGKRAAELFGRGRAIVRRRGRDYLAPDPPQGSDTTT